jgi:hypothetical protein
MTQRAHTLTTAADAPWDAPGLHVICGAHVFNNVVQEVLSKALKATHVGIDEEDETELQHIADQDGNVVVKVGLFCYQFDPIMLPNCFGGSFGHWHTNLQKALKSMTNLPLSL